MIEHYTFPDTGYGMAKLKEGETPFMEGWDVQYSVGNDPTFWVREIHPVFGSVYYRFIKGS